MPECRAAAGTRVLVGYPGKKTTRVFFYYPTCKGGLQFTVIRINAL